MKCPVCLSDSTRFFIQAGERDYWRCEGCLATFLELGQLPDRDQEKAEYDQHQNDPLETGYRAFLNRLAGPLLERLPGTAKGLDYGCGPGPALAMMLREAGHFVATYDPIYQPDADVLNDQYDFITATEVVEHFHYPAEEFERLKNLLRPGGWLGIMTRFQTDDTRFANWHYRRDPTHVVFYRAATFSWLADKWGWQADIRPPGIVLLQKPE
jgi:SAM-dependent methyltransferase